MTFSTQDELRPWLSAVAELTGAVNAGLDLPALLDLVAATGQKLLTLDFCGIMLPSQDGTSFTIAGSSGLPRKYIARVNQSRRIRIETDGSQGAPASRAFRSGRPTSVADLWAEPRSSWTEVARRQGYRSILAVPLTSTTGVLGTLNSYRSTAHTFTDNEIEQLALLAEHAAIAITSARIRDDLREQHRLISRSEQIHDRLVRVAARSGGVVGITTALHDLLGCEVVVSDSNGEVLAAQAGPEAPAVLDDAGTSPRAEAPGALLRDEGVDAVADVVLDGAVVASVRLAGQAGRLDPLGVRAAEHASVVLSLELLRLRTAAEVEQTLRGELLADLLADADPSSPAIRERAQLMGHHLAAPHRTLVAKAQDTPASGATAPAPPSKERTAQQAAAHALRQTSHLRPRPLIAAVRELVVALWPEEIETPAGHDVLRRSIAATHEGAACTVVVSAPGAGGYAAAYRVTRGALAFAAADRGTDGVLTLDDLGAAGLLLQYAEPAELRRYAEQTVGAIIRYDVDHGAELLRTLHVYVDSDLDRRATGALLVVHPNTVSQRLRRIEALAGLDLRSARSVIDARTALMLLDVVGAIDGPPT